MRIHAKSGETDIDKLPNSCPFCLKAIRPSVLDVVNPTDYEELEDDSIQLILLCPSSECHKVFVGYYDNQGSWGTFSGRMSTGNITSITFSDTIESISPSFSKIYNQAHIAEQQGLLEICGVGYRKALEFLIKDYAIDKQTDAKETIEKKMLMQCIDNYVDDKGIKSVAKRAVWLGNDETHYVRRWEGKNLEDLKKLIELTEHWIEMEKLTESFEEDMPEGKK